MPTVLRVNGYRFFFFSHEQGEPAHVHIEKNDCSAKVWLNPVILQKSTGFRPHEINVVLKLTQQNATELEEKWHDYFN
jgi:hypothetical protein